jgi:AraC-like DNA-binding protein
LFAGERGICNRYKSIMDSITPGRLYFDTDALPERDRFPAFCEGMFRHIVGADIAKIGPAPFRGTLDVLRAGVARIANISVTAATISRHANHVSDGDDDVVIQLWQQGLAGLMQGKHESCVKSREALIIDNAMPARICTEGPSRFWALLIPRQRMIASRPEVTHFAGAKVADQSAFQLLFSYLEEVVLEGLQEPQSAQLFGNHLVELAALALGGAPRRLVEDDGGIRAARRSAILREIERRSGDQSLNAVVIAASLGVTPRYVHLLLEGTGRSFTHHVLERRLVKAAALLRDPRCRNRKIADIAAETGFTDLSYFNRAFRRHFGATPSDIREAAMREAMYSRQ